jgi:Predicted periplasmic solute-binding protein
MSDKTPKNNFPDLGDDDLRLPDIGENDLEKLFEDFGVNQHQGNSGAKDAAVKRTRSETKPERRAEARPEPWAEVEPVPRTEVEPEPEAETEPEPEKSRLKKRPKAGSRAKPKTKPETGPNTEDKAPSDEMPEDEIVFFPKESPEKRHLLDTVRKHEESLRKKRPEKSGKLAQPDRSQPLGKDEMLVYDSELDDEDSYDPEDIPEARDYHPIRFNRYGRLGVGRGMMYALFIVSVSVMLACVAWLFASDVLALNKPETDAVVTISAYQPASDAAKCDDKGRAIKVDADQVANALKDAGVIQYKWLFKLYSKFSNADVKIDPGTYDVSTKLDYRALVTSMQTGSESMETTRITFPEGYTEDQIFKLLEDNKVCSSADLYAAAANTDFDSSFLKDLDKGKATRVEGYLFPDTYDFYQGESAGTAINRFLNNFQNKITADMESQASSLGYSMHDIIIIASLIEKEAGSDAERADVASVIYNRLKNDDAAPTGFHHQLYQKILHLPADECRHKYRQPL